MEIHKEYRNLIEDIDYWRSINPQSKISDNPHNSAENSTPYTVKDDPKHLQTRLNIEGYFSTEPILSNTDISKLRTIIENVVQNPPYQSTYALLYDDFYHVAAKLKNLIRPLLGANYWFIADEPEAYHIPNSDSEWGSDTHRDSLSSPTYIEKDGRPLIINIWVALTDVTPLDSCMYVVPAQHDSNYPKNGEQPEILIKNPFKRQTIRAVPVKAGAVIGWSTSLIHWGSYSSSFASHPRMSFAMYYQSSEVPPFHYAHFKTNQGIPFPLRLHLVEKAYSEKSQNQLEREFRTLTKRDG